MKGLVYQNWAEIPLLEGLVLGNAVDVEAGSAAYVLEEAVEDVSVTFSAYRESGDGLPYNLYYAAFARNVDGCGDAVVLDIAGKCFVFAEGCHVMQPVSTGVFNRYAYVGDLNGELLVDCGVSGWFGDVTEVYSEDGEWVGAGARFRVDSDRRAPEEIWSMLLENIHVM